MANQSGASAEALPLPKGGGSTRGLGDGFTPDLNRGTGGYAIELQVPKGHRNLTPRLTLGYNTASGDGPFGYGWSLPVPRIQIDTDTGVPDYLAPRYVMDGETLVPMGGGVFRPRVENAFHRIRQMGEGWELTDKGGNVTLFGATAEARVSGDVLGAPRTFEWLASSTRDTSGNEVRYSYIRDRGALYLSVVAYAAFDIRFEYEPRPDPSVSRRAGFPTVQALRCHTIEVRRPADLQPVIRRYRLEYADEISPALLRRVSMRGFKHQPDGTVSEIDSPAVELTYSPFDPQARRFRKIFENVADRPGPLGEEGRELVDLDGNALPDVVQLGGGRPRVWRNAGEGRFMPPRTLADFPQPLTIDSTTMLFDADGRGTADVVSLEPGQARYYPNGGEGKFDRPRFLGGRQPLSFNLGDPDTTFADTNGDGRVDLLKTTAVGLVTWENLGGDAGFGLPHVTPRSHDRDALPDVRLSDPGVFVSDMTGDGLPDIVHITSGLVEYWPSLGGGRYDRRQVMTNSPQLPRDFNPRRLFLADADGTGTSDVIYVDAHRVMIWRNLGGARFSDPIVVNGTPETPLQSVRVVDLFGTGNAGILWSEVRSLENPGYRFLSLTDVKPFLLTSVNEGIGLIVRIDYGSSSAHASTDARVGQPWTTQLPVPVPVVDRISRHDLVTGLDDATEIFYHDGRWDPSVRRFRGFGRVTVHRIGDAETLEVVEEYRYLVGAPGEPDIDTATGLRAAELDLARRGQIHRSTFFSGGAGSSVVRTEETRWGAVVVAAGADGMPILFPQVRTTEVQNSEGSDHPRVVTTAYDYDGFGNVTRERRRGHAPNGDDNAQPVTALEAVTETEYALNVAGYVVDRVARVVRRDTAGGVLGEVRHYYDGATLAGLPLGEVGAGLLRRQEEIVLTHAAATALYGVDEPDWLTLGYHNADRIDGAPSIAVNQTRYDYSPRGMIARRVDAFGGETRFAYD
ncbi:MAG: hypothetical protein JWO56_1359, partial [Acidobacteria bacterium]|nr:hypothetical protein [Acidobacteriota bacterium]